MANPIRVLIVDDSAFMCKVLESIISSEPGMQVAGAARDGREAIAQSEALRPDVITMDIDMPHMNGLEATEVIMSSHPRPILIVSSESRAGAAPTLRALELGAIDFVPKPANNVDLDMNSIREELCRKIKLAAKVRVVRNVTRSMLAQEPAGEGGGTKPQPAPAPRKDLSPPASPSVQVRPAAGTSLPPPSVPAPSVPGAPLQISMSDVTRGETSGTAPPPAFPPAVHQPPVPPASLGIAAGSPAGRFPVVCIAASTGGPATLMQLLPSFPADFPAAALLIQHMPGAFTTQFVEQLAEVSALRVKEAEAGELIVPGTLYVCPGSHHLRVSSTGRITLDDGPRISGYRPSADAAMETVGLFAGPMSTAVVLTGMGSDAARGVTQIKAAGGHVIAQDEATSVIFGMPGEAVRTGAVDQVLPLDKIYQAIEKRVLYALGAARVGAI